MKCGSVNRLYFIICDTSPSACFFFFLSSDQSHKRLPRWIINSNWKEVSHTWIIRKTCRHRIGFGIIPWGGLGYLGNSGPPCEKWMRYGLVTIYGSTSSPECWRINACVNWESWGYIKHIIVSDEYMNIGQSFSFQFKKWRLVLCKWRKLHVDCRINVTLWICRSCILCKWAACPCS